MSGCDCDAYDGDHAPSCAIYVQPAPRRSPASGNNVLTVEVGDWARIKGQHGKVAHLWLYPARVNPYFIAACGIEHPSAELVPRGAGERSCASCGGAS